jgi:hypothetical protein
MDPVMRCLRTAALLAVAFSADVIHGRTISWSSPPNAVNLSADGHPMNEEFRFELGVFSGSFDPAAENKADWAANWNRIQRTPYDPDSRRYTGTFTPQDNNAPFVIGKPVYVWGFRGDAVAAEWILFRASTWLFPDADPMAPPQPNAYVWLADASGVTAIVGSVESSGIPHLLRTEAVAGVLPPTTTWDQWQEEKLAGTTLNGPGDDLDADGLPNILEFAFGLDPRQPGALPHMPLTLEQVGGQDFLQIRVPRRKDHRVTLAVQVSSDLVTWQEGATHVEIIDDTPAALVVRDLTTFNPANPKRFIRLKASVP